MTPPPPPPSRIVIARVSLPALQLMLGAVVVASGWGSAVVPSRASWRAAKLPSTTWKEVNLKTRAGPPPWRSGS
jgi:hypothetical protein